MLLTAIVGVGALSIDMFLPSLPTIAAVFGAGAPTAQLTVTLFLAGLAVSQLVWGPLSDRLGRRRVLLTGLALYALAGTACAFVPGIRTLIAARVVQAFGAGSGPVMRARSSALYEPAAPRASWRDGTAQRCADPGAEHRRLCHALPAGTRLPGAGRLRAAFLLRPPCRPRDERLPTPPAAAPPGAVWPYSSGIHGTCLRRPAR